VKNLRIDVQDDDNDTALFERLQKNALQNHPNPQRIGCPDHAVLEAFVEAPGNVDLEAMHDLHIFKCAECTRDLIELRREREERLSGHHSAVKTSGLSLWKYAAVAACLGMIAVGLSVWRGRLSRGTQQSVDMASVVIDLSGDGVSRSVEEKTVDTPIQMPRKMIHLRLLLPFFSPAGSYRVSVSKIKSVDDAAASATGTAVSNGAKTELPVDLDLHHLPAGAYYLGTFHPGDGPPYFYPLVVR
jgi:hypothetical protein